MIISPTVHPIAFTHGRFIAEGPRKLFQHYHRAARHIFLWFYFYTYCLTTYLIARYILIDLGYIIIDCCSVLFLCVFLSLFLHDSCVLILCLLLLHNQLPHWGHMHLTWRRRVWRGVDVSCQLHVVMFTMAVRLTTWPPAPWTLHCSHRGCSWHTQIAILTFWGISSASWWDCWYTPVLLRWAVRQKEARMPMNQDIFKRCKMANK